MKKVSAILILIILTAAVVNVFGQTQSTPFLVKMSGKGKRAIIFIPGLGCSGDAYATKGKHFIMYDDTDWYNQQFAAFIK